MCRQQKTGGGGVCDHKKTWKGGMRLKKTGGYAYSCTPNFLIELEVSNSMTERCK